MQWKSGVFGFALEHGIHGSFARACGNPSGRNIGVCLECHLNHPEPVTAEDCISLLPDVTERANEVIPVQHCSWVILRALSIGLPFRGHLILPI